MMVSSKTESLEYNSVFSMSRPLLNLSLPGPMILSLAILCTKQQKKTFYFKFSNNGSIQSDKKHFLVNLWIQICLNIWIYEWNSEMSPELLLNLKHGVTWDYKHLVHVVSEHVTGVADVHCRLCNHNRNDSSICCVRQLECVSIKIAVFNQSYMFSLALVT